MIKIGKKLLIAGLCLGLALTSLTGCGTNAKKTVATLDGQKIELGLVNFILRFNQAEMNSIYSSMFGADIWKSMGETSKASIVENIEQMLILEQHSEEYKVTVTDDEKAKIAAAAKTFMESNDKDVLKAMTASQEVVERMLTLNLIQSRMRAAISKDINTEVSDEEAAQKTITYVMFSTAGTTDAAGNETAMPEADKQKLKEDAQKVAAEVKAGKDMDAVVKEIDEAKSASTVSYGKDNGSVDEKLREAADKLKDGEVSDVIETDKAYYVVQMKAAFDKEATESYKPQILMARENAKFDEVYGAWKEKVTFTTDEKLLAKLTFEDTFEIKTTEAASEAATTEAASETTAETAEK